MDIFLCYHKQNVEIISSEAELFKCHVGNFYLFLSGTTSSLTSCANLLYLLRKNKNTSIKNTNAVMQPVVLPTIIFMHLHLSLISVLSSMSGLVDVESKLNNFCLFFFFCKKSKINVHEFKSRF